MVTHAGKIFYSSAANQHGAVLLQIVPFAGDVNRTLLLVRKTDSCDLTERGVGLLGRSRRHRKAYAALLRASVQNRALGLERFALSAFFDELVDRGHFLDLLVLIPEYSARLQQQSEETKYRAAARVFPRLFCAKKDTRITDKDYFTKRTSICQTFAPL